MERFVYGNGGISEREDVVWSGDVVGYNCNSYGVFCLRDFWVFLFSC